MKYLLLAPLFVLATASFAHQGVKDPQVMARMALMTSIADEMKVVGEMAKGAMAYDAVLAKATAASLRAHASDIPVKYEAPATDPKSEALPTIWTSYSEFAAQAQNMVDASAALEAASQNEFQMAFTTLAKTCSSCHKSFRAKKKN